MADISSVKLPNNSSYNIKAKKIFYADCTTAKSEIAKVVTCDGFVLEAGATIAVRFTDTTTTAPTSGTITLNINGTGAKNIVPKGNNSAYSYSWNWAFCNNQTWLFTYNGTSYVCLNQDNNTTYSPKSLGFGYGTCTTAEDTTAKVATLSGYTLVTNGIVAIKFTHSVYASSTLNINSKGAKSIYYKGAAIADNIIKAGQTAMFIYNGSQYHLISVDETAVNQAIYTEDLNNIIIPGFYSAAGGNSCGNKPDGVAHFGLVVIHRASGAYYTQILFHNEISYTRYCENGTWTAWVENKLTDEKVKNELKTTTKAYVTGTTSATTNTGTQVFDTGVYLDTTAGQLVANTFKGDLSGTAENAIKIETFDASGNPYTGEDKENNKVYVQWDGVKYLKLSNDYNKTAADYAASAGIVGVVNYPSSGTTGSVVLGFKPSCVIAVSQSFTNSSAGQKSFAVMITGNIAQTLYHPNGSVIISLTDTGFSANFNSGTVSMFRYIAFK